MHQGKYIGFLFASLGYQNTTINIILLISIIGIDKKRFCIKNCKNKITLHTTYDCRRKTPFCKSEINFKKYNNVFTFAVYYIYYNTV